MRLQLHNITIELRSDSTCIRHQWQDLFGGWLTEAPSNKPADICLHLEEVAKLPPLPQDPPFFNDQDMWPGQQGTLSAYRLNNNQILLHFHAGALIDVSLPQQSYSSTHHTPPAQASGVLSGLALRRELVEDITYTSLAPLLRRKGYFLLHAFAAAKNGHCLLIVGPTQSGKTTTGLCLILNGWQLLSNDAVLLEARPDGVYALATPGDVGIRPKSFKLLPELANLRPLDHPINQPFNITGEDLVSGRWSEPVRIHTIVSPQIKQISRSYVKPQARALCFANLMRESVDRWDESAFDHHINILQQLSSQVSPYDLFLGPDLDQLPDLLADLLN